MGEWDELITLIYEYMAREGVNQAEFARRSKLSPPQLSRILNRTSPPGVGAVKKIAHVLSIPEDRLMVAAGLIASRAATDPQLEEANSLLSEMSPEARSLALALLRTLYQQHASTKPQKRSNRPRVAGSDGG